MDQSVVIANERRKAISSGLSQLGLALVAAAAVKAYVDGGFGLEVLGWLFIASLLISASYKLLGLLEQEN